MLCRRRDQVRHVQLQRPGYIGDCRHDHYERPFRQEDTVLGHEDREAAHGDRGPRTGHVFRLVQR